MAIGLYLLPSEYIDWEHPDIIRLALNLWNANEMAIVRNCFEYVRDEIKHSYDYKLNPITCKASDVLRHRTGYCYAKSHLLAALLRANNIPAGLCYQRLSIDGKGSPFCLHGLNAVYLQKYGWHRIDPRGDNDNIHTDFNPPYEHLAYKPNIQIGEVDLPQIYTQPLQIVTNALTSSTDYSNINLPDIEIVS